MPVEQVSWYEAVEFCDRLNRFVENRLTIHTNRQYRLPTEAEWEYACRAGTTTPFHFGETITTDLANYSGEDREIGGTEYLGSYGSGPKGDYRKTTIPIDQFNIANAFGLCDMHGNVLEWCQDHWHKNYKDAPSDGSAWLSDSEDANRLLRGGSWNYNPGNCRSASRYYFSPAPRDFIVGLRVSCSAPRT